MVDHGGEGGGGRDHVSIVCTWNSHLYGSLMAAIL